MKQSILSGFLRTVTTPFTRMPGKGWHGALPELSIIESGAEALARKHVYELAGVIGERHIGRYDALQASVDYICAVFEGSGYKPRKIGFPLLGKDLFNVEATRPGRSGRVLVVGAHYDSIPGCAGADDNASGTAAVLTLAELLKEFAPHDTIRFLAFANEEHPCLPAETMGSYDYARLCRRNGDKVRMMVLEMLGFFKHEENTQHYPFPFSLMYPTTGNFLGFVGNYRSRQLVHDSIRSFRKHARFPSDGVAAPDMFKDIGRSDHWGFWQFGYPAIMITDTANFRNPHYHTALDTIETLDYSSMGRVIAGLADMIKDVAGRGRTA